MPLRPARLSDTSTTAYLDWLSANTSHLSLLTGSPWSVSDPRSLEPTGAVYARCAVAWTRSGRLLLNAGTLTWSGIPQNIVITEISGWDAAFNGELRFSVPVESLTYEESLTGGLVIGAEQFYVGLDL